MRWLDRQLNKLLPVPYFLITFTVPEELRGWFRSHPQTAHNGFFAEVSATLKEIGANPKWLGAELGFLAVLHTWTRQLQYHPHLHVIVPGGGLTPEGKWKQVTDPGFFLPSDVLAARFRNRMKALLHTNEAAWRTIPVKVWNRLWVVNIQPAGSGENMLKYLARYVGRTALSSSRILSDDGQWIRLSFQDSEDKRWKVQPLKPMEFLRRFLQHVLPGGLQRVRYYGFLAPAAKGRWQRIVRLLHYKPQPVPPREELAPCCPFCHGVNLFFLGQLPRAP